jgi:hypothetical protein
VFYSPFWHPLFPPHLAVARHDSQFSSPSSFTILPIFLAFISSNVPPIVSAERRDGLSHNATNGFVKTNGNGAHYEDEDTPMSEDDDVPLVCDPTFF